MAAVPRLALTGIVMACLAGPAWAEPQLPSAPIPYSALAGVDAQMDAKPKVMHKRPAKTGVQGKRDIPDCPGDDPRCPRPKKH